MRTLEYARQCGRGCRLKIDSSKTNLFQGIVTYIKDRHSVDLLPVKRSAISGSRAEVSPPDGFIYYDKSLDQHPAERLWVIAHELGHLELHEERLIHNDIPDPIWGTGFANGGAVALARYNPRSFQEAQANAFAAELLFPSQELFAKWFSDPAATSASLANELEFPKRIVRAQLTEGLYHLAMGGNTSQSEHASKERQPDDEQGTAAIFRGKAAIVSAGPGTGKTATLVYRVAHLLNEVGARPDSLLILTFSNEAAEELRDRIADKFDEKTADEIEIATFHGFGLSILLAYGHHLEMKANTSTLDETSQEELLIRVIGSLDCSKIVSLKDPSITAKDAIRHISRLKNRLLTPDDFERILNYWTPSEKEQNRYFKSREFLDLFREYEKEKRRANMVDFADMISLPIEILDKCEDVRTEYQAKYQHVLLDEYQDVSRAVAELLKRICGPNNHPWGVGDVRQAIYLFLGAARENVYNFASDFPGAQPFELKRNYRSCQEVVTAANQLATLLENPDQDTATCNERWIPGTDIPSIGDTRIKIIQALSDKAESIAIADQVASWIQSGVPPGDIAVLCRRNVDVRNIMLSLKEAGIQATTCGVLTPEGAAGDLAAIATYVDRPGASLARIVYSLGRHRFPATAINECIKKILALPKSESQETNTLPENEILTEFDRLTSVLNSERHNGDAFEMMCAFLFDGTSYLRRILESPDNAERSLILSEIITSLGKAAGYRFTHPKTDMPILRIGFGEFFRSALCSSTSSPIAPRPDPQKVQVMTCHASKGLEFPCVIVAGQTQPIREDIYDWLPQELQPPVEQASEQADALLFVGITRGKQAAVITYADTPSGAEGSRQRPITSLLERWQRIYNIETTVAKSEVFEREMISLSNIWGGTLPASLPARALSKETCHIRTYLEQYLGLSFPVNVRPMYPIYIATVRRTLRKLIPLALENRRKITVEEARTRFLTEWPDDRFADNPLAPFYRRLSLAAISSFIGEFQPTNNGGEMLELAIVLDDVDDSVILKLGFIAHYCADDGASIAITFQPKSLKDALSTPKKGERGVKWSALELSQQIPMALLRRSKPDLRPFVFSTVDGFIYPYNWSTRPTSMDTVADGAALRLKSLADKKFEETIDDNKCNRCPLRISCPHWLGAIL